MDGAIGRVQGLEFREFDKRSTGGREERTHPCSEKGEPPKPKTQEGGPKPPVKKQEELGLFFFEHDFGGLDHGLDFVPDLQLYFIRSGELLTAWME